MNNKVVYVHKLNGEVVYVGSGCKRRVSSKCKRSAEHIGLWDSLDFEIIAKDLSILEAIELEQRTIDKYWYSGKLFNKNKSVNGINKLQFDEISEVFCYDEKSPTYLIWKKSISRKIKNGSNAGSIGVNGYSIVGFKGKDYLIHRIILVLHIGKDIPDGFVVDHIDGNRSNNNINNLRIVSGSDNSRNKAHKLSNTGFQCICERQNQKRFILEYSDSGRYKLAFSYADRPNKTSKNHYPTRELALEAALLVRDMLVDSGKIILTNKEEL